MWQYSSTGRVSGISGDVDLDECYVDYPSIIKAGGFNGFKTKPLDTEGYKRGMHDLGIYYMKQFLKRKSFKVDTTDGFGGGTEQAVNALLSEWGYEQNGIAGEQFARLLTKQND